MAQKVKALRYADLWNILGLPAIILGMVIFFSTRSDNFLTVSNFKNIGQNIAGIALLAIGEAFIIVLAEIDISVGAIVAMSTVVGAASVQAGLPLVVVMAVTILTGTVIGLLNGLIITRFMVHSVIVTIGMLTAVRGLAFVVTNGTPIVVTVPKPIEWLGIGTVGPIPVPLIVTVIAFLVAGFVLRATTFGTRLYASGGNEEAARLAGINVKRVKIAAFVVCGSLAGMAGLLYFGRISSGQPTLATGLELQAIAAAVVGGMALTGGRGTIAGVALGVLVLTILQNGLEISNTNSYLEQFVSGVVILIAVAMDHMRRGHSSPRASPAGADAPADLEPPQLDSS